MYHIQIVDDDAMFRGKLSRMLDWNVLGFEVSCLAHNGKEALEQLEIEKVDLIITDIEMPLMDGLSLIREIRWAEGSKKSAKEIIVLTAYDDFDYAKRALHCGVSEYLLKPVDPDELTQAVRETKRRLDEKNKN